VLIFQSSLPLAKSGAGQERPAQVTPVGYVHVDLKRKTEIRSLTLFEANKVISMSAVFPKAPLLLIHEIFTGIRFVNLETE